MSAAEAAAARARASGDGKPVTPGTPVLEARGLVKTFGHVVGLAGVSLKLYPDEVLAIIGDNGAGKSTLIKGLSGALTLDEGEILMDGTKVVFKSPVDARLAGIETVYQTLAVARRWTSPAICSSAASSAGPASSARSCACSTSPRCGPKRAGRWTSCRSACRR